MMHAHRTFRLLLAFALLMAGPVSASVLEESLDAPRTRPISRFDHDTHNEIAALEEECALCHHTFDESGELLPDETSEDMACRECHGAGNKDTPRTEAAFHNRCKGCHLKSRTGPITCGQCHSKVGAP